VCWCSEAKKGGKLKNGDLIRPPIYHPYKPLTICNKVKSGIELVDNLFVPIILEAHHLSHLQLITSLFDEVEVVVAPGCYPLPINPLGLYHMLLLIKID
jgi:hypothetical protein